MTQAGLRPRLSPRRLSRPATRPRTAPDPATCGARARRDTTPLYWVLPVPAAVAGWAPLLPWPMLGAGLFLVVAGALTGWWLRRPLGRGLAGLVAVLVTGAGAVLGADGGLLGATVEQRLLLGADLTAAGVHLFLLGCWAAGLGAARLATAGAAVWVRPGPAVLLLAWAGTAHPQQRLDVPVLAVTAAFLAALALPRLPHLRRLPALLLIALTVAGGAAASPLIPLPEATARHTGTGLEHVATTDPLALATGWQVGGPQPAFRVQPGAGTMRWAVLDRYNGMHWDTSACTPAPARPGTGAATTVAANALPGPWLAVPEDAAAAELGWLCPDPGTLLTGDPVTDYTVWTAAPAATPRPARGAVLVTDAERALASALIGPDPGGRAAAADEVATLERLAQSLRRGRLDPSAVPGHERGSLLAVAAAERTGNGAQFAAAFALLAAAEGHPARVVIGFDTARGEVTTSDVQVWPEAWAAGRWRRFDPQPGTLTPTEQTRLQPAPTAPHQQEVRPPAGPDDTTPVEEPDAAPDRGFPARTWLLLTPAAAAVALTPVIVLFRRRRHTRRRRPADRILTAWGRTLRRLTRHDTAHRWQAMTPRQVATAAQVRLPGQAAALHDLAELVTLAGFSGQDIDAAAAARAELRTRQIGTALRRTRKDRG